MQQGVTQQGVQPVSHPHTVTTCCSYHLHPSRSAGPGGIAARIERERLREEARRAKDADKARAAAEREAKRREAAAERERRAEEKRRAAEDKRRCECHKDTAQGYCSWEAVWG